MKYGLLCVAVFLCTSLFAYADVRITEIAWMGTSESQYGEWFELYNDSDAAVSLVGWKITDGAGVAIYTLSKTIDAGGYLLVERVTASQNPYPNITDEEGTFGSGGLSNVGEDIFLKDKGGTVVQELLFAGGWPAGDGATKDTMQWDGSSWITAQPTPNAPAGEPIPSDDTDDGGGDDPADTPTKKSGTKKEPTVPLVSPNKPKIEFTIPPVVYRNVPYQFIATPVLEYDYRIAHGSFYWNMGDGSYIEQHDLVPVTHTYRYPGTYTIYFSYADPDSPSVILLEATKTVTVIAPTVSMGVLEGTALQIKNTSGKILNLSGWQIRSRGITIPFSSKTIIAEGATTVFPYEVLGIAYGASVSLIDPFGRVVATTEKEIPVGTREDVVYIDDTIASDSSIISEDEPFKEKDSPQRNRTRTIVFGAVALFVIALSLLLERFMARQE